MRNVCFSTLIVLLETISPNRFKAATFYLNQYCVEPHFTKNIGASWVGKRAKDDAEIYRKGHLCPYIYIYIYIYTLMYMYRLFESSGGSCDSLCSCDNAYKSDRTKILLCVS